MRLTPQIAVVSGGPSPEAEVSRSSAREVVAALRQSFGAVASLELDASIGETLAAHRTEVVFPVLHGPPGEDGTFQGFLEILGLPYVGSGVHASACAMDKIVSKHVFAASRLPLARDVVVQRDAGLEVALKVVSATLGARCVVKPARQGSALGVALVESKEHLRAALEAAFALDRDVLVEEWIEGREITVGVFEREELALPLPVCEIRTPADAWYDYEHRYTKGLSEHVIPAPLSEPVYRRTQEVAVAAHRALGCRDLSRVDFVVPDGGDPVLLEVNTLPGMTATSLYPDEARAAGMSFPSLVAHFVDRAFRRATEAR